MKKKEWSPPHLGVYLAGPAPRDDFPGLEFITQQANRKQPDRPVKAFIIPHTHADVCWPEIPDYCIDACLACINDLVGFQRIAPGFRFSMEHAFYLRQYLMKHPESTEEVVRLIDQGYFECGAFYLGPTELTAGGESIIRELYLGKRWLKEKLGIESKVVWNVDCPGHTQQLPQILERAGVPYLVIWKEFNLFEHDYSGYSGPCLFQFTSPDGSSVLTCFSPGGYGVGRMLGFRDSFDILLDRLPGFLEDVAAHLHHYQLPQRIMIADGNDVERPTLNVVDNIQRWNEKYTHPHLQLATSTEFFNEVDPSSLPKSLGEAPNWWDTIGSFQNERVMSERHCEPRQAAAEAFSTFASLIDNTYEYPSTLLEKTWENRLFASEHNSGGRNGLISDAIKLNAIKSARVLTDLALNRSLAEISLKIHFQRKGIPIVIFNSLLWPRNEIACIKLEFTKGQTRTFKLIEASGKELPYQFEHVSFYQDSSIKECQFILSVEVPPLGYTVIYLVEGHAQSPKEPAVSEIHTGCFENEWFRLATNHENGLPYSLVERKKQQELLNCQDYFLGELLALENIAHDEDEHLTGKYWRSTRYRARAWLAENGPLRATWIVENIFKGCPQRLEFMVYRHQPRIDITTTLDWQGEKDLQVMQVFPFRVVPDSTIQYGVPFGYAAYKEENPHWTKIHPSVRGVRDWVNVQMGKTGINLASEVIPFDFQNRLARSGEGLLVQPILLKTTYSCHDHLEYLRRKKHNSPLQDDDSKDPELNRPLDPEIRWSQNGRHTYRFSLMVDDSSFDPARTTRFATGHQTPLFYFVHYESLDQFPHLVMENILHRLNNTNRTLPENFSFASCVSENIIPTWVKQAENGDGIIIRCHEAAGKKGEMRFDIYQEIAAAWRTDIIEYDQEELPVHGNTFSHSLAAHKIETLRVKLKGRNSQGKPAHNGNDS